MTTENLHNFNADNQEIEIIKDFVHVGSVISLNLEGYLGRNWKKIPKCKDTSLETKANRSH